jgi:hypothetical protein
VHGVLNGAIDPEDLDAIYESPVDAADEASAVPHAGPATISVAPRKSMA